MANSAPPQAETIPDLDAVLRRWAGRRGSLIMVLHDLQRRHGYVPWSLAKEVARRMHVPLAQIYEVLTFYHYFKIRPPGEVLASVCMGTACVLKGSQQVLDAYRRQWGIEPGGTTPDRHYELQTVRCVGSCSHAPVLTINGRVWTHCSPNQVPAQTASSNSSGTDTS